MLSWERGEGYRYRPTPGGGRLSRLGRCRHTCSDITSLCFVVFVCSVDLLYVGMALTYTKR